MRAEIFLPRLHVQQTRRQRCQAGARHGFASRREWEAAVTSCAPAPTIWAYVCSKQPGAGYLLSLLMLSLIPRVYDAHFVYIYLRSHFSRAHQSFCRSVFIASFLPLSFDCGEGWHFEARGGCAGLSPTDWPSCGVVGPFAFTLLRFRSGDCGEGRVGRVINEVTRSAQKGSCWPPP